MEETRAESFPYPRYLRVPFIFVPHGAPMPLDWMAEHPGWVKISATFVPRAAPEPEWPAGEVPVFEAEEPRRRNPHFIIVRPCPATIGVGRRPAHTCLRPPPDPTGSAALRPTDTEMADDPPSRFRRGRCAGRGSAQGHGSGDASAHQRGSARASAGHNASARMAEADRRSCRRQSDGNSERARNPFSCHLNLGDRKPPLILARAATLSPPGLEDRSLAATVYQKSAVFPSVFPGDLNAPLRETSAPSLPVHLAASYFDMFSELNMSIHTMERMNQRGISPSQLSRALRSAAVPGTLPGTMNFSAGGVTAIVNDEVEIVTVY